MKKSVNRHKITLDDVRSQVKLITAREKAKEPWYYETICKWTSMRKAQDCLSLFNIFVYFGSAYLLWNYDSIATKFNISRSYGLENWKVNLAFFSFYYMNCLYSFIGSVMTHNVMHTPVFKNTFLNRIVQFLLTLQYGHPVCSYVPGHNLSHHKYTQSKKDIMNTHLVQSQYNWYNFVMFMPTVGASVMQSDFRYILYQREQGNHVFVNQSLKELLLLICCQLYCLCANPLKFVQYFFLPHLFAQYWIVTLSFLQHDGCEEFVPGERFVNFNTSRNFTSPLLNFLCLNNGYHTIHHLVPTSHWSLGKVLHDEILASKSLVDANLNWDSMLGYCLHSYFYSGNPWNAERRRLDFKGELIKLRSLDYLLPHEDDESGNDGNDSPRTVKEFSEREDRRMTLRSRSRSRSVRAAPATEDSSTGKLYKRHKDNKRMYEEWLNLDAVDPSKIPDAGGVLLRTIMVLVAKLAISPMYSLDPNLRLI
jgi:fatty acid desaturase